MRYIQKLASANLQLQHAHMRPPETALAAKKRWTSYSDKRVLLNELLIEQFHLCCYSEIRADRLGLGYHIEHVEPKSRKPQRTFDFSNLAASALTSDPDLKIFTANGDDYFGGHLKANEYDVNLFVSCHQPDCARFFAYSSLGHIAPAAGLSPQDWAKAEYTIKLLGLDCSYLQLKRADWWDELEAEFAKHREAGTVEMLCKFYLTPEKNHLQQFYSLSHLFFCLADGQALPPNAPWPP